MAGTSGSSVLLKAAIWHLIALFVLAHCLPLSYTRVYNTSNWQPDRNFIVLLADISTDRGGIVFAAALFCANMFILIALLGLVFRRPHYTAVCVIISMLCFTCSAPVILAAMISHGVFSGAGLQKAGPGFYLWCVSLFSFVTLVVYHAFRDPARQISRSTLMPGHQTRR